MKTTFALFFLTIIIIIAYNITGCSDDIPVKPGNNDPGILRTDEFGNILGGDTTDWCLNDSGSVSFGPAYPNPVAGPVARIKFYVPVDDTVKIYILKSISDTTTFFNSPVKAGSYSITMDSLLVYVGTYQRIYFKSKLFSPSQYCRFYGDIKFEE